MYRPLAVVLSATAIVSAFSVVSCKSGDDRAATKPGSTTPESVTPDIGIPVAEAATPGQASQLAPNKLGRIPVLEYHLIGDHDALYSRTREHFRADLEYVYKRGYRPVN